MRLRNFVVLLFFIMVCELAGIVGSVFTAPAIQSGWYATLARPALSPPAWVFGPVWTTLYLLMGISAWLVWRKFKKSSPSTVSKAKKALALFGLQLVLNTLWSIIFFGLQSPGAALTELMLLWLAIIATIAAFWQVSRTATWLLIPYILWTSFALYLNAAIYLLN